MSDNGNTLERNRLGPYKILRRLRGVTTAPEVGKVYKAVRLATGRPALVVRGVATGHYVPEEEWRLRVRAGTGPEPYVALEVERAPQGKSPVRQIDAGLNALRSALEGLEQHPEAAAHLRASRVLGPSTKRGATARISFRWLAVAGILAAAVLVPRAWHSVLPPAAVTAQDGRAAAAEEALGEPQALHTAGAEEALAVPQALPVATAHARRWMGIAIDMPPKPFPGQYRPDKNGTCKARTETPINGGCWVALDLKPPCGDDAYEWKNKCYWPSMPAPKEPSSIMPRAAPVPTQPTE